MGLLTVIVGFLLGWSIVAGIGVFFMSSVTSKRRQLEASHQVKKVEPLRSWWPEDLTADLKASKVREHSFWSDC